MKLIRGSSPEIHDGDYVKIVIPKGTPRDECGYSTKREELSKVYRVTTVRGACGKDCEHYPSKLMQISESWHLPVKWLVKVPKPTKGI